MFEVRSISTCADLKPFKKAKAEISSVELITELIEIYCCPLIVFNRNNTERTSPTLTIIRVGLAVISPGVVGAEGAGRDATAQPSFGH